MRLARLDFMILAAITALGCGSAEHGSTLEGHLEIAPAELRSGSARIALDQAGRVRAEGRLIGVLHPDGRLVAADGKLIATLGADGRVTNATGYVLEDVIIDGKGVMSFQGRRMSVQGDGTITGSEDTGLRVEVAPSGRRAAMFVLLVAALSGT